MSPFGSSPMADASFDTKQMVAEQNQANPSKFYNHFLYKALLAIIFLVILPLFPSQAPEFINQTMFTRSWELLHLLFVGIAVSYGLFSRRNDETEKENNHSKFDNAQSYVSRFLQVSPVFDEDSENLSGSDESKVQTWSNQYYRIEPVVVVARDRSVLEEQRGTGSRIGGKPLLLPVRSLKSRILDADGVETSKESSGLSGSISRSSSNLGSKRFSSNSFKAKNGDSRGLDNGILEKKFDENVVFPSPIPWRSRSGRMEVKEDIISPSGYDLPPSMEQTDRLESRSFGPQTSRSSRPNSNSASPKLSQSLSSAKKLSPSPSFASESPGKPAEDLLRKKGFYKSPPPPPPPPPMMTHKPSSMKLQSTLSSEGISLNKDFRRSYTSQPKDFMSRVNSGLEVRSRGHAEGLSNGMSVRTIKQRDSVSGSRKDRDTEDDINGIAEIRSKESEPARKTVRFDPRSYETEKLNHRSFTSIRKQNFVEFSEEENDKFVEKMISETDDDSMSEEEDDDTGAISFASSHLETSNSEEAASGSTSDGGPDVDKKADEFIAKFREQIRLQRIESIKRSSAQISRNSLR